ncbi:MAG TPA: S41 family peptidase [Candidatus Polarisedimenticolaceae bacterium]|nr:S41 family peptidase [Candidatus Polarisedimenticolaceae bacterium]
MRPPTSWTRAAAAAAFGFLGLALALTSDASTVVLAAVLLALLIPMLSGWAFPGRPRSLRRVAWVAVALPGQVLLAVVAWNHEVLDLAPIRAAGALLLVPLWVATVSELLAAGAAARAALAGRRFLVRALPGVGGLLLAVAASLAAYVAWPPAVTRMTFALELQAHLLADYPHRDATGPDLEAIWEKHAPRLRAADRACGASMSPCLPFAHALRDWMAELGNGHTWAALDGEVVGSDVLIEPVEGRAVIVEPGEDGGRVGLEAGMVVLAVDGVPVEHVLARLPGWAVAYRAARTRRYYAYRSLLDGPPDTEAVLTVEDEVGRRREVRMRRPASEPATPGEPPAEEAEPEAAVDVERLPEGYGYVWLEAFEGSTFASRAEEAIDAVSDLPGLVLDLRHNAGGYTDLSRGVLAKFFSRPITVGLDCVADPEGPDGTSCTDHLVEPHGKIYPGPIAVLIDEDVFSAGELAAHGLCSTGRARCFGRPTAGETDAVVELPFPGGHVGYAASDFRTVSGNSLFGRGVVPQQLVPQRLEDVRAGRDPDLTAALDWLDRAVARRGQRYQ